VSGGGGEGIYFYLPSGFWAEAEVVQSVCVVELKKVSKE